MFKRTFHLFLSFIYFGFGLFTPNIDERSLIQAYFHVPLKTRKNLKSLIFGKMGNI